MTALAQALTTSPRTTSGRSHVSGSSPGSTTSSSWARPVRRFPERALARRGPGHFETQNTCTGFRRSDSALPSSS
eukprot:11091551-Alexandrium_andersonii.AAC.1